MPKHRTSSAKMAAKIADMMMCCNNLSIDIGLDDSSGGGGCAGHQAS